MSGCGRSESLSLPGRSRSTGPGPQRCVLPAERSTKSGRDPWFVALILCTCRTHCRRCEIRRSVRLPIDDAGPGCWHRDAHGRATGMTAREVLRSVASCRQCIAGAGSPRAASSRGIWDHHPSCTGSSVGLHILNIPDRLLSPGGPPRPVEVREGPDGFFVPGRRTLPVRALQAHIGEVK